MKTYLQNRTFWLTTWLLAALRLTETNATDVFPIAANAECEFAFGAGFDGSNYLVAIQSGTFTNGVISAQLIVRSGGLVGTRILTGESGFWPQVAFDGTNNLITCSGSAANPGFRGQFISKSGDLVTNLTIHSATPRVTSLAYGGGKYLACWSHGNTLMGQLVTPAGELFGTNLAISGTIDQTRISAIAFDGTKFFVVFDGGGNLLTNIYGRFVSPDGSLGETNILIDANAEPSDNSVAVAFDGQNTLRSIKKAISYQLKHRQP
jgi:hypothetical protein